MTVDTKTEDTDSRKKSYIRYFPYYCLNHISYVYLSSVIGYKSLFMRGLAKGGESQDSQQPWPQW